jgi:hypothetical protein
MGHGAGTFSKSGIGHPRAIHPNRIAASRTPCTSALSRTDSHGRRRQLNAGATRPPGPAPVPGPTISPHLDTQHNGGRDKAPTDEQNAPQQAPGGENGDEPGR